jgi:hypothetical protein
MFSVKQKARLGHAPHTLPHSIGWRLRFVMA